MIPIVLILLTVYVVVFRASRPSSRRPSSSRPRSLLYSIILAITLFAYSFIQSNRPPLVDYYANGWLWMITSLNTHYASVGNPNRIPDPGR